MKKGFIFLVTLAITGVILWSCSDNNTADPTASSDTWIKVFGGTGLESGRSVDQTTDGGFIITGWSEGRIGLIKTNSHGNKEWFKLLLENSVGYSVKQTTDGGYIITGKSDGNISLLKTDESGNEVWSKAFGEGCGYSVQQTIEGGYIFTGTIDNEYEDVFLFKADPDGNITWSKTFVGTVGNCVQQTTDRGYIITGNKSGDVYLIKTDENGNEVWSKTFGGTAVEASYSVQQTTDGGYVIVGQTNSFGRGGFYDDVYLIKADADGGEVWFKTFLGNGVCDNVGFSVQQTTDGGYIISGLSGCGWDLYLIKTDKNGDEVWSKIYGGNINVGFSVQQTIDGGYVITGDYTVDSSQDMYLIKTDSIGNFE